MLESWTNPCDGGVLHLRVGELEVGTYLVRTLLSGGFRKPRVDPLFFNAIAAVAASLQVLRTLRALPAPRFSILGICQTYE